MAIEERSRVARAAAEASGLDEARVGEMLPKKRIAVALEDESENGIATFLASVRMSLLMVDTVLIEATEECWRGCLAVADALSVTSSLQRVTGFQDVPFDAAIHVSLHTS
ncbi:MAG TPA: hypothetical protein VEV38_09290, partial [Candidatus Eremiobacteraceae bacterium]|nr:hypothetical protein [Candidatus Eremiobacteraceae bacterium]